ncbi:aldo/keto reductase [Mycobacterium botniense]|uniref:Putative oxidoreductase n=1 Tax=Mycobacterium botniense TaxID=84962 RepID=A0A7I9XSU8_9MYCO|nr:aldo/keto reductase [Mycobacterium botniense]GFG73072.1 putative oxidoreductase [Mycobacterium botniense]
MTTFSQVRELTTINDTFGSIPSVSLNDNTKMPVLGLGVAKLSDAQTEESVAAALEAGCRLIDTAAAYGNEEAVGRAIAASNIPREELFVTTKLGTSCQGYDSAQQACEASLERLGLDYIDLYLIHWPAPQIGKFVESFEGMIQSREAGHTRSIGVSNFTEEHLDEIIEKTDTVPAVNQIELHPRLNQAELRAANAERGIVTQSYSPLGVGRLLDHPTVTSVAAEYDRTPAQVLLRWNLQLDNVVVSRSGKPERVVENLDVFDFELAEEHVEKLNSLHDGTRVLHDPLTFTGT